IYRVDDDDDVARLHRVLVYRELGFPLAEISVLLDDPAADEHAHLARQRELLLERISHLQEMVSAVDRLKEAIRMNTPLSPEDRAEIFGTDWNEEYQIDAEERWGETPQWEQTRARTATMSNDHLHQVKDECVQLNADQAQAKLAGVEPGSPQPADLAEGHRARIEQYYYCTHSLQVCRALMFTEHRRFAETYEGLEPGLQEWL